MLIGELASKAGCSRDTIRFYQKVGLVEGSRGRTESNNYRHYDEQMVERILLVKKAKLLGFTLDEIKGLIVAWERGSLSGEEKTKLFVDKIALVDQRISELKTVRNYLKQKLTALQATSILGLGQFSPASQCGNQAGSGHLPVSRNAAGPLRATKRSTSVLKQRGAA